MSRYAKYYIYKSQGRPIVAYRSKGYNSFHFASRRVYLDLFNSLDGCQLSKCRFPTLTCNKCSYAFT